MVSIKSYAKMGFGVGVGVIAAQLIYMALGLLVFVIGLSMLSKARKNNGSVVPAYIVMGIGMILGLGLGAGLFFDNLSKNLNLNSS